MPFGVKKACEFLQYIMDKCLGRVPGVPGKSFFDDVQIPCLGGGWASNWSDVLGVLRALTQAGFMINLRKCKFMEARVELLGLEIFEGSYRIGEKSLRKWASLRIPRTLHDLQQLLGRMLWASPFVPDYKRLVRPIEALLGARDDARWTAECTEALNEIARVVFQRLTLAIPDAHAPLEVHVSVGEETGGVVMVQGGRAISLLGRRLTKTERKRCDFE
jgi:hypothetical protein